MPDDPMKQILTRAVFALKTPSPDGSTHYQSGWDDGLEAAIDEVGRTFDQVASPKASEPLTTEEIAGRIAAKSDEPSLRALASAWGSSPGMSKAVRRKLRKWAYAAGHIESELDDAADRLYAQIAQDVITRLSAVPPPDGEA